ncbi:MAG: hypothetical protein D6756_02870 [Cyanobacteria bacterium J083]|nr:MAG: hypothetical protein D6756_02870 [Cyanobacteria bacterium J083]
MDRLQAQISALNQKVDQLHAVVERIGQQITLLTQEAQAKSPASSSYTVNSHYDTASSAYQANMEHKDILLDGETIDNIHPQEGAEPLSPDLQIRRLTAQLTAAYNRIAALEEQLLATRIRG